MEQHSPSSFYDLSNDDQARRMTELAKAALTQWDGDFGDPQLLKYRENAVFSVKRGDGVRVALRIHRAAYHSDAELRSELYWMTELARSGIDVPPIIPASKGDLFVHARTTGVPEERQVDMLGWVSGAPMGSSMDGGDPQSRGALFFQLGALAAQLHARSSQIALPDDFFRHRWDEEGLLGDDPLWGRFWELPALTTAQRDLLLAARGQAAQDLEAYGKSGENFGMIHADLVTDNVLDNNGRLQLIDFDDCGFGWYLFELATALNGSFHSEDYRDLRDQLLAGYHSVRPLSEADLARLPLFQFLRASTYLGWLQTRSETETARKMGAKHIALCCRLAEDYLKFKNGTGKEGARP